MRIAHGVAERGEQGDTTNGFVGLAPQAIEPLFGHGHVKHKVLDARVAGLPAANLGIRLFSGVQFDVVEIVSKSHFGVGPQSAADGPPPKDVAVGIAQ